MVKVNIGIEILLMVKVNIFLTEDMEMKQLIALVFLKGLIILVFDSINTTQLVVVSRGVQKIQKPWTDLKN